MQRSVASVSFNKLGNMTGSFFVRSLVLLLIGSALGRSVDSANENSLTNEGSRTSTDNDDASISSLFGTDFRFLYRMYNDCAEKDLSSCLKTKLVTAMDRASRSQSDLKVFEGVSFIRDPSAGSDDSVEGKPLTEAELEASLPRGLQDKENLLDGLIMEKILGFFKSHTLQFKLPTAEEFQRSLSEEARKKKKGSSLLLLPLMMAGMLVPIALAGLALLAGKALIISKLALVLAGIIGLKKLLGGSGGGHHEASYQVVSGHGGSRNFEHDPHLLAYRSYAPQ
ncbi:uncharacterized protein Osi8 [Periplaneta americana]|uniref:uncharacterized protein Osi8 n=1 Tax=Periplaneta americana TaxID=6978 RepID=UPI0037E8D57E